MNIIGIAAFGGSSAACLVRDGRILAAVREDSFSRDAGDRQFPRQAIAYCLRAGKIGPADVDVAAVTGDATRYRASDAAAPSFRDRLRRWVGGREPDPISHELDPAVAVHSVEEVHAHAAAAFYSSPFSEAAVLVLMPDRVELAIGRQRSLEVLPEKESAAGRQAATAESVLEIARQAREATELSSLALGGPLASHPALVGELVKAGIFERIWAASTAGSGAIGAALRHWYSEAEPAAKRTAGSPLSRALGPVYNSHQIRTFLRSREAFAEEIPRDGVASRVAALLADGLSVGWFQGRLEFADEPVASRSILSGFLRAEPPPDDAIAALTIERGRETLSLQDEGPFGNPVLHEDWAGALLGNERLAPRGITFVERTEQRLFHDLLTAFERLTGEPALLARPLSRPGEPVACTPTDAYEVCRTLRLDAMVMGPYLFALENAQPLPSGAPLTQGGRSREIV